MNSALPKRLIEVDLPIKRISAHARREKSVRNGHISTLHIWWARRPLAACRAVTCAALWPDPADDNCPAEFRALAADLMFAWARDNAARGSAESAPTWTTIRQHTSAYALCNHPTTLRAALLDFIADFADWGNSAVREYLETARTLTSAATWALSLPISQTPRQLGWPGLDKWHAKLESFRSAASEHPAPIVVDPFAGGGAFPIEAARLGANSYAGDYNILAYTINKFQLEMLPVASENLPELHRKWSSEFLKRAHKELLPYYPAESNSRSVVGYLWARTIKCEGPNCGCDVPILKTTILGSRSGQLCAVDIEYKGRRLCTKIINHAPTIKGTSKRSSVTCPKCGYTTPRDKVAVQANGAGFGFHLYAVGYREDGIDKTLYREPTDLDFKAIDAASKKIADIEKNTPWELPTEELPYLRSIFNVRVYGIKRWCELFTNRQLLSAVTLVRVYRGLVEDIEKNVPSEKDRLPLVTSLALSLSNSLQYQCNIATWLSESVKSAFIQGQSLPMKMDFIEANPLFPSLAGSFEFSFDKHRTGLEFLKSYEYPKGEAVRASAATPFLPPGSVSVVVTDPPYYDVVPYADCSDFFNVWLYRMSKGSTFEFPQPISDKSDEIVQLAERNEKYKARTKEWFELRLTEALKGWNLASRDDGKMVIVFAHKQASAWEALLGAVLNAGWIVTASWPLETENASRMRANESAVLSSSIHLVCEPRRSGQSEVGDWRDVLQELPRRIHDWMPRLAREGIVGADAIFACLGPALEGFSRYSRVEKASGEQVTLREYLEHVWAAVSKEALSSLITGSDLSTLETDARITAMWLWTLNSGSATTEGDADGEDAAEEDAEEEGGKGSAKTGFLLEYDAARKIAQGLGANLEDMRSVVAVKGDEARLLPVAERTAYLFGKDQASTPESTGRGRKKKAAQMDLFAELTGAEATEAEAVWEEKTVSKPGATVLDRVHQSMILFATGRGEALKRFLVEDGIGREGNFWKLAQALSALYPSGSQEKRWVDGVLARKKGLGL